MTVHCAWCDEPMRAPARPLPRAGRTPVSDGICPSCLSHQLAALTARPAPATLLPAAAL